ncbi:uncharacterized protein [Procambarus clarkii]|uniref:uncharacterized protein n=1 Tax=Procambarus clarkii TaxID=6728 RepID=UPI003742ECD6
MSHRHDKKILWTRQMEQMVASMQWTPPNYVEKFCSCEVEVVEFQSLELLSLYTCMMVKRYTKKPGHFQASFPELIKLIEKNLARLKVDKKWFFATIRDQSRLYHDEWDTHIAGVNSGRIRFNSYLLLVALRLGLEKLWVPDGCLPFEEDVIMELKEIFSPNKPNFALKQLSQSDPMFDFFANHSPNLEILYLPRSDISSFQSCVKFTNLRVIELAGGVSDKVMCSALWNVNKKSDKVLEMAIKEVKEPVSFPVCLPHLETLRNNMLQTKAQSNAMRLSLGAAALAIQPNLQTVETLQSWDTYSAILYLLDMEAKQRSTNGSEKKVERKFAVTCLTVNYEKDMDMDELERVMLACPKLSHLMLNNAENIHKDLSLLCAIIPVKQVKKLNIDASKLTNLELTVLLAEMCSLEHLTLELTPQAIIKFNLPNEADTRMAMLPTIKTLVIEFLSPDVDLEASPDDLNFHAKDMMSFLSTFSLVKELYFYNTLLAPAPYLVYGCIGGSLAVLHGLRHLSVISCHEDIPRELTQQTEHQETHLFYHYKGVPRMLADLQDETTFKHLRALESLEIDEFYINSAVDSMIEALRLSGVMVAVHYRPGVHKYPNHDEMTRSRRPKPRKI